MADTDRNKINMYFKITNGQGLPPRFSFKFTEVNGKNQQH